MYAFFTSSLLLTLFLSNAIGLPTSSQSLNYRNIISLKRVNDGMLSRRHNGVEKVHGIFNRGQTYWAILVAIEGYSGVLSIDTGSADSCVFGEGAENPNGHPIYYPADNNADPSDSFDIEYLGTGTGEGRMSGEVAFDSVTVANFQVARIALSVATTLGSDFANIVVDGIIGFGFQGHHSIKPDPSPTFFEATQTI